MALQEVSSGWVGSVDREVEIFASEKVIAAIFVGEEATAYPHSNHIRRRLGRFSIEVWASVTRGSLKYAPIFSNVAMKKDAKEELGFTPKKFLFLRHMELHPWRYTLPSIILPPSTGLQLVCETQKGEIVQIFCIVPDEEQNAFINALETAFPNPFPRVTQLQHSLISHLEVLCEIDRAMIAMFDDKHSALLFTQKWSVAAPFRALLLENQAFFLTALSPWNLPRLQLVYYFHDINVSIVDNNSTSSALSSRNSSSQSLNEHHQHSNSPPSTAFRRPVVENASFSTISSSPVRKPKKASSAQNIVTPRHSRNSIKREPPSIPTITLQFRCQRHISLPSNTDDGHDDQPEEKEDCLIRVQMPVPAAEALLLALISRAKDDATARVSTNQTNRLYLLRQAKIAANTEMQLTMVLDDLRQRFRSGESTPLVSSQGNAEQQRSFSKMVIER